MTRNIELLLFLLCLIWAGINGASFYLDVCAIGLAVSEDLGSATHAASMLWSFCGCFLFAYLFFEPHCKICKISLGERKCNFCPKCGNPVCKECQKEYGE